MNFTKIRIRFGGFTERVDAGNGIIHKIFWKVDEALILLLLTVISVQKFFNFRPFAKCYLLIYQGVPKIDRFCVTEWYINLSGLLVGFLVCGK